MKNYHLLPSVRGDLLKKLGRLDEARTEFERAAQLTQNARERASTASPLAVVFKENKSTSPTFQEFHAKEIGGRNNETERSSATWFTMFRSE